MSDLAARLIAAHGRGDKPALVALYGEAAAAADDTAARGFFLTQAWVYALDCGHPEAEAIAADLRAEGRA